MKTILVLAVMMVFLLSKNTESQIFCPVPQAISPTGHYVSVDPPVFVWHSVVFEWSCQLYLFQVYWCLPCGGGPVCWAFSGALGQDTIWYIPNSMWNTLFPLQDTMFWVIKVASGSPQYGSSPCGPVTRLQASLPPVSLLSPPDGEINVDLMPRLDWSRIDSATSYRVRIFNDPVLETIAFDSVTTRDSIKVSAGKLITNKMYWWRVKPYNNRGEGPYSDVFHFTTLNQSPPPAPVLVSPPNNSTGNPLSLTLTWNASAGAISYRVQMALDSMFTYIVLNDSNVTNTTRLVSNLSILTKYYWRVNAKNLNGIGPWSAVWNFKTMGIPTQVTLLLPPNNSVNVPTSYTFAWSKAYDQTAQLFVSNYWYERVTDTVSMANLLRDTTLTDTTKSVTGMNNNTSYYWRVKAKNQIGWGNFAPWFKFTTVLAAPSAPVLIVPINGAVGQSLTPKLDWSVSPTATSYRVQVTIDSVFGSTVLDSVTSRDSLIVPSGRLANNTRYYWRVNASNAGGTSPWSLIWHFNTLLIGAGNFLNEIPKAFNLYTNYPNPFNPSTVIKIDIPEATFVRLVIYDITGQEVAVIINQQLNPGTYETEFNGSNYPSGIYFYKLETENFVQTKKMVLIK